jgi:WD40 repeat protein
MTSRQNQCDRILVLAFSPDGKTLASGTMDQTVKLWDAETGQLRETIVRGESESRVENHRGFVKKNSTNFRHSSSGELDEKKKGLSALVLLRGGGSAWARRSWQS